MYGDGWILDQLQKEWINPEKFEGGWRIDIPCHITSTRFEFPITFSGSRKKHHWSNPTPPPEDFEGHYDEGIQAVEFDYDTFSKKLMEDLPSDLDMNGPIWFIGRDLFEVLTEKGKMGYSDFVILKWIIVHFLDKNQSLFDEVFNIEELLRHYFNSSDIGFDIILQMIPSENKSDSINKLSPLMPDDWVEEI